VPKSLKQVFRQHKSLLHAHRQTAAQNTEPAGEFSCRLFSTAPSPCRLTATLNAHGKDRPAACHSDEFNASCRAYLHAEHTELVVLLANSYRIARITVI
jgi:hypothetical protein